MTVSVGSQKTTVVIERQQAIVSINQLDGTTVEVQAALPPTIAIEASPLVTLEAFGNGPQGVPGPGIITSGSTNQVLSKASNSNFDMYWQTLALSGMSDVDVSSKTDGSVLVYDGGSQKFVADSSFTSLSLTDGGNF
jgi:hypothetical protein